VPATSPTTAGPALPLTPEQRAQLDALPAATRDLVLTWLLTGDPILVAEAKKKLAPLRPRPEAPRMLPEVLTRIREDPSFPALAADWLASALGDRKSYSGFKARWRRGAGSCRCRGWCRRTSRRRALVRRTAGPCSCTRCVKKMML
jgi:hypothetical protein